MLVDVVGARIKIVEGAGGPQAVSAVSRIHVQDVPIWYETMGMTADEIVLAYPTITRAEVFAALAYYWDHRDEIEGQIEAERGDGRVGETMRFQLDEHVAHPVAYGLKRGQIDA